MHPRSSSSSSLCEAFRVEWIDTEQRIAGFTTMVVFAKQRVAWYWSALVGEGRDYLLVRDQTLAAPQFPSLEVRGEGIWAVVNIETPDIHWTLGLEAFGVSFDKPEEALSHERGDRVGFALDLDVEISVGTDTKVFGDVMIGVSQDIEKIVIDATGTALHYLGDNPVGWLNNTQVMDQRTLNDWDAPVKIDAATELPAFPRGLFVDRFVTDAQSSNPRWIEVVHGLA